jgi:sulfatase maturation enzyme AslB (radical SAM superfamily)
MEVQSLSVCVPAKCPNKCKFCVSQTHDNDYKRRLYSDDSYAHGDFVDRLEYARDNGVQCLIFTGTGEPLMNMPFLNYFAGINRTLSRPYRHIEIQTSGVTLDDDKLQSLKTIGVKTISLSLSSLESAENALYNGTPKSLQFEIVDLCKEIKHYGFNLRLSLNMTDAFCGYYPDVLIDNLERLGANQVTFRVLYESGKGNEQDNWIKEHRYPNANMQEINSFVRGRGTPLYPLSFGAMKYDINGMSVVIDDDCMNTEVKHALKYFILRENCRLYTHWDKKGSLVY